MSAKTHLGIDAKFRRVFLHNLDRVFQILLVRTKKNDAFKKSGFPAGSFLLFLLFLFYGEVFKLSRKVFRNFSNFFKVKKAFNTLRRKFGLSRRLTT
jgi:hypothetical protein